MPRRTAALLVLSAGSLVVILDGTIVNTALPSIQNDQKSRKMASPRRSLSTWTSTRSRRRTFLAGEDRSGY